jgi:ABC-type spermidine/putrescine transport system permease subunit II
MNNLKFFLFSLIGFVLPISLLAQSRDMAISNDEVAYASVFAGDLSLLLSIVIGLIATYFVFRAAKKMGGGLFGSILNYIAIGMVLVVIGTISIFLNNWFSGVWFNVINTFCFATGYIFMVIGANKLLKGILSN